MTEILYQDDKMIVCIKPAGISSQNDGMGKLLSQQTGSSIFCVHRLDKAVSGVMVYAKDSRSAARLSESLHGKQYLAIKQQAWESLKDYAESNF